MLKKGWLRHWDFILADFVALELALVATLFLYRIVFHPYPETARRLFLFFPFVHLFSALMLDAYNGILQRGYLKEFTAMVKLESFNFSIQIFFCYFLKLFSGLPQMILVYYFAFCVVLTCFFRFFLKFYLHYRYKKVKHSRQIVVATTESVAREMIQMITASAIRNYQFFGLVLLDRSMTGEKIGTVTVAADKDEFIDYVQNHVVDEVLINVPNDSDLTLSLARELLAMGITVHIYMENAYQTLPNRCISNVFGYNVLTTTISPISFTQALGKRLLDISGGIAGCLITLILTVIIGPMIYAKSPGPVFFSQIRVGKKGRTFKLYKFRSMYLDAEERKKELMDKNRISDGMMFKMEDDPRIIKGIGQFIRKTSLDEFPQFFNVLRGDMSMVGTRPPTVDEYQRYSPHHKRRLSMQPGITGLWQVSGRSAITDFEEVVRLDTQYIENWSLEQDLKIICKTIAMIWKNDEAF